MKYEEELRRELGVLTNYPEGLQRAITAVEGLKIDGSEPAWCFYGHYVNPIENTNEGERADRAEELYSKMRTTHYVQFPGYHTPIEAAVAWMLPGVPLNEEEQAFLALCKEIQKEHAHA